MDEKKESVRGLFLIPYMEKVIGTLRANRKLPAVRTYTATKNSFVKFSEEKELPMEIMEVFTPSRLKEYQNWLRCRDAEWNTVSTYMRTLKAVYNRLVSEKALVYDRKLFSDVYTKVESQTKRALSAGQMGTLLHTRFEELPENVQYALAYFLLMFLFHGMPFIDLAYLRKKDMKGDCIVYCRHKTGRQITVRIPPEARALLEQYSNKDDSSIYLFPILDRQVEGGKTKDTEKLYECYGKALGSFNRILAKIASLLLPGVEISSYTARHTWATLAFHAGVPIGIISKALGHSSIKVTETYLKPFDNEKVDVANDALIGSITKYGEEKNAA
ncbi:site-specific integrase [Oscillospiraceae bacterium N12]|jgi:integrase|uniref:Site-specific integrase n=1 Tax=Jilunia laotingensis TaxID=2763675 RepID=A0A926IQ32_9BACT|nr:site-specific integrase [Jilunia laotingensis]MBC8593401.1 site-specific integrase [Jilunia laotingensis]